MIHVGQNGCRPLTWSRVLQPEARRIDNASVWSRPSLLTDVRSVFRRVNRDNWERVRNYFFFFCHFLILSLVHHSGRTLRFFNSNGRLQTQNNHGLLNEQNKTLWFGIYRKKEKSKYNPYIMNVEKLDVLKLKQQNIELETWTDNC